MPASLVVAIEILLFDEAIWFVRLGCFHSWAIC
jgi:hypothetical protein